MFDTLIGQNKVKSRLEFYVKARESRGHIPALLMNGAKGLGKTQFAKEFAREVGNPLMEINCSTIKNEEQFVEQVFIPMIMDKDVTVLFDECHGLPKKMAEMFLTVFNTDNKARRTVAFRDYHLEFDLERQVYLFATTDPQKLSTPFKDRMEEIHFSPYSYAELADIVKGRLDWVQFTDNVLDTLSQTLRGNARSAVKRAVQIEMYLETHNQAKFGANDWKILSKQLDIMPYGLTATELQVLKILKERGDCTLQMLSAVVGMDRSAIQREIELHLLREGFIRIDGKRQITTKGQQVLDSITK